MTPDRSAPEDLVEALAGALQDATDGRCESCFRPIATDEDWETTEGGERPDLCWESHYCGQVPEKPLDQLRAEALAPTVARLMAQAAEEAVGERLAGVRDGLTRGPHLMDRDDHWVSLPYVLDLLDRAALHPKETDR